MNYVWKLHGVTAHSVNLSYFFLSGLTGDDDGPAWEMAEDHSQEKCDKPDPKSQPIRRSTDYLKDLCFKWYSYFRYYNTCVMQDITIVFVVWFAMGI